MTKIPFRLILKYYWEAQTIYSAHSPFIFEFMTSIMNNKSNLESLNQIEEKRKDFLVSKASISFREYGAGSLTGVNNAQRKVSDVARHSLSGRWQCELMHNIIAQNGLKNILEIGTSLGISTAYLAAANPSAEIITLEGNSDSALLAKDLFENLKLKTIDVRIGEFGETLNDAISDFRSIDFAFLDGNHRKKATIEYFQLLKTKTNIRSVFVVDDIYWSKGMNDAWNEIIADESVAFSIDLFRMGILFFDHSIMPKQHFKLISYRYKPWSIGMFG